MTSTARIATQSLDEAGLESFFMKAAGICSRETLAHFRRKPEIENKKNAGFDPVTDADKAAERALRQLIMAHFPDHGIIGEEYDNHLDEAEYLWILDPVDGTRAFISGLPSWGCLVGLLKNGEPIAGMMHQPFTGETYLALQGKSWLLHGAERQRLTVSSCMEIGEATLMSTAPEIFGQHKEARFNRVRDQVRLTRFGFDCYGYAMVASGHVDLVIESDLNIYDIAPLIPLIENAGGLVTDWSGNPLRGGGDVIAASNGDLHKQALKLLNA